MELLRENLSMEKYTEKERCEGIPYDNYIFLGQELTLKEIFRMKDFVELERCKLILEFLIIFILSEGIRHNVEVKDGKINITRKSACCYIF